MADASSALTMQSHFSAETVILPFALKIKCLLATSGVTFELNDEGGLDASLSATGNMQLLEQGPRQALTGQR